MVRKFDYFELPKLVIIRRSEPHLSRDESYEMSHISPTCNCDYER